MNKEYITSERFIWDDLLEKVHKAHEELKAVWRKKQNVPTTVATWPATPIRSDDGRTITHLITLHVPTHVPLHKAVKDLVVRTKAYAFFTCDGTQDELRVVLESHHGVRSWTTPIERHGDVRVLGETRVQDGVGGFGLLWQKKQGSG